MENYSSCDIADALVQLGKRTFLPGIKMHSPRPESAPSHKLAGQVVTVKMVSADCTEPSQIPSQFQGQHYLDWIDAEGRIIVIQTPSDSLNAVWGGLMTARAKKRGVLGVIVDGRCRDVLEMRQDEFTVFSRDTSVYGAGSFTKIQSVGEPVEIASVSVKTGDYIVADIDGVVVIPKDMLDSVLEKCKHGKLIDDKCLDDLKQGLTLTETFKKHRQ